MRKILMSAALLFLSPIVAVSPLWAQEGKHPAKPLLWKIEGNGLGKPSYLFGTIHLGAKNVTTLHPEARKAFDSADAVYTEVPMGIESQLAAAPLMMRKDGKSLNESLGGKLGARLDEELKVINPALDSEPFQSLATWAVAISLPLLPDKLAGKKALDLVLWEEAAAAGKKTAAMETVAGQIGVFADMPEAEQVILLSETMRVLKEDREGERNSIADLTAAYASGEADKVEAEMKRAMKEMEDGGHGEFSAKLMKRMLTDRDVTMAASIAEILAKDPGKIHFFAAGAGHFCSETGIRSHLENKGYTVTRIGE